MATTADFRNGMCLNLDGTYYFIVEFLHVKPGKGPAFVRTKLKNVTTGRVIDKTWNSGVKVDEVRIERRPYQFLYKDDMGYNFMHTETCEQINIPVYSEEENKNPVEIAQHAITEAKKTGKDLVIVDTAGRLAIDKQMMQEIKAIKDAIKPDEILFVVYSMTGQDAVNTAKEFNDRLDFSGVVLTKLDGDTRGGAALSIRTVVDKPIKFVGTCEKS